MASVNPNFDDNLFGQGLKKEAEKMAKTKEAEPHSAILKELLKVFEPIDFKSIAYPEAEKIKARIAEIEPDVLAYKGKSDKLKDLQNEYLELNKELKTYKVTQKQLAVISVEKVLEVAESNKWGLCKNLDFIYLFNGCFWSVIDEQAFAKFLGESAEKMGVDHISASHFQFREHLYKQFLAVSYLPEPERIDGKVFVNLRNGTFEISGAKQKLKMFDRKDFLTYQLPFNYDPKASPPLFEKYLNQVLPDINSQKILAEYLGYVFIDNNGLKLEKALVLFGSGANGKSVFFEIVTALFGKQNISNFSLQNLTDENGYYRAMFSNKLLNYASEINGKLNPSYFKQLASGEPVDGRLPYGRPLDIERYGKMIFNANELPRDTEQTKGFFRKWLIVPFNVTISDSEQDPELPQKIIKSELSGVLNWVLIGLNRLLKQKKFTKSKEVERALERFKIESDSVKLFLEENGYTKDPEHYETVKELYLEYKGFCIDDGHRAVKRLNFKKRLEGDGVLFENKNIGQVAFLKNDQRLY